MTKRSAIITGISGQDGSYLAQLLVKKGYDKIIGVVRPGAPSAIRGLHYLGIQDNVRLVGCQLMDPGAVYELVKQEKPQEIYNLAAQSSVGQSFQTPNETFTFNTASVINLLEAIRKLDRGIRLYQASSSEMFGNVSLNNLPIKESLLFHPVSPYGISKASAHWLAVNYREAFGLFTSCGILFNHESALRGPHFVVKKIINTAIAISRGQADVLTLGNLAVSRDWGYAPRYVEAMWHMLQADQPDDYIICSGNLTTLQEIVIKVFRLLHVDLEKNLRLSADFMRSLDLTVIYGDNTKAKKQLAWNYDLSTDDLISKLVEDELDWMRFNELNRAI